MERWLRARRGWLLALCVLAGAGSGSRAQAPGPVAGLEPAPPEKYDLTPRVTLELRNVTLQEAARTLGESVGEAIYVRPPQPAGQEFLPDLLNAGVREPLDYTRRATLSWKDRPFADALRDLGKAYDCAVENSIYYRPYGHLSIVSGGFPQGPTVTAEGYELSIGLIDLSDGIHGTGLGESERERKLTIHILARSITGDPTAIWGLRDLRLVDGDNHAIPLAPFPPPLEDEYTLYDLAQYHAYPDTRYFVCEVPWPYPAPRTFRSIEGLLTVRRELHRLQVELPMPAARGNPTVRKVGPVEFSLLWPEPTPSGFSRTLHATFPRSTNWTLGLYQGRRSRVYLQDGSWVRPHWEILYYSEHDGLADASVAVNATGLKSGATALVLDASIVGPKMRYVPFRFVNYPAGLAAADVQKPPARPAPPAPRRPGGVGAVPKRGKRR